MWKVVLCLCVARWSLGEAQRSRSTWNLEEFNKEMIKDITNSLNVDTRVLIPTINTTYVTKYHFDMRGMGPLYNITEPVIDTIANIQAYPEGVVTVSDGHLYVSPPAKDWRKWLSHYLGPVGIVLFALLFAVVLPLAGLFWCCCYWCRMGRRRRPFDREWDSWIRGILAIVFIALLTLFLLGVVCVFATEAALAEHLEEAPETYRGVVGDVIRFLNTTQEQAIWMLERNFFEIKSKLMEVLQSAGTRTAMVVSEASNLMAVSTLYRMVQQLDDVRDDLRTVHNLTNALRMRAVDLNAGLRIVKNQLLHTLSQCDQPKCVALHNKYKIGQLDTEIQYDKMPDVSGLLANVSALADSGLKADVARGHELTRSIQRSIQSAVDEQVPHVRFSVDSFGETLQQLSSQIRQTVGNATARLQQHADAASSARGRVAAFVAYRQYLCVGAALVLLLVTLCLAWGVLLGVCGARPDVYGAHDCCSKPAGARSLLCGVAVVFTLGAFVAVAFAVIFTTGVLAQRFVCEPFEAPVGNRLFADLDRLVDVERTLYGERKDPNLNLTSVLVMCHLNYTIYELLQLHRVVDLERLGQGAARRLGGGAALRPALAGPPPRVLSPAALDKLRRLADSGLAQYNFDRILDALDTNMTSLALESLARQLNSTAQSLARPQFASEARQLLRAAADLERLSRDVLAPMLRDAAALNETATRLRDGMRWGGLSVDRALQTLAEQASGATEFLAAQGDALAAAVLAQYRAAIAAKLQEFLLHATYYVRYEVGRCGPLSALFNATRDSVCVKIVTPMNGYWIALGWCVVLLVPLVVTARRLADLYMQLEPYPGPLVEAEYLYDAYADRDNVPLANAYKAEKRGGREVREGRDGREAREPRGEARGGGEPRAGASALAPPLDAHHARRYNDMAPKHWEEGPPRYHGPTEYERPPPYYYPGPNDRQ